MCIREIKDFVIDNCTQTSTPEEMQRKQSMARNWRFVYNISTCKKKILMIVIRKLLFLYCFFQCQVHKKWIFETNLNSIFDSFSRKNHKCNSWVFMLIMKTIVYNSMILSTWVNNLLICVSNKHFSQLFRYIIDSIFIIGNHLGYTFRSCLLRNP